VGADVSKNKQRSDGIHFFLEKLTTGVSNVMHYVKKIYSLFML